MVQRHRGVRLTPTHDWDQRVAVVPTNTPRTPRTTSTTSTTTPRSETHPITHDWDQRVAVVPTMLDETL